MRNNNPYKLVDSNGQFGVLGGLIGVTVQVGVQLYMDGKVSNWTALGISGAIGGAAGAAGKVEGAKIGLSVLDKVNEWETNVSRISTAGN